MVLTLLTGGFWAIVWLAIGINNDMKRSKINKEIAKLKLIEACED